MKKDRGILYWLETAVGAVVLYAMVKYLITGEV